jgi:uncharacterized protein YciI
MSEPRYFFCRLIPPRPNFSATMTAEERTVMQNHVACWGANLQRGAAIVFGPVADPAGDWGVGIIAAADEAAAYALRDADPAIQAGRGFRYEILPMPRLIARQ